MKFEIDKYPEVTLAYTGEYQSNMREAIPYTLCSGQLVSYEYLNDQSRGNPCNALWPWCGGGHR